MSTRVLALLLASASFVAPLLAQGLMDTELVGNLLANFWHGSLPRYSCVFTFEPRQQDSFSRNNYFHNIMQGLAFNLVPIYILRSFPHEFVQHAQKLVQEKCNYTSTIFIVLSSDPSTRDLSPLINQMNLQSFKTTWLMLLDDGSSLNDKWIETSLKNQRFGSRVDTVFWIISFSKKINSYILTEVIRYVPEETLGLRFEREWNETNEGFGKSILPMQGGQIEGVEITAVIFNSSLSIINGTGHLCGGIYYDIWKILENKMKFKTKIFETKKVPWLQKPLNGDKWDSFETVVLEKGTIGISGVVDTWRKRQYIDLSPKVQQQKFLIYVSDPNSNMMIPWDTYTAPFSGRLWLVVIFTIIFIALILFLFYLFYGKKIWHEEEIIQYDFLNCVFSIYRAFCNQGQEFDPKAISTRIVFITTYITTILLLTCYSGVLISFLATGKSYLPFDSFDQLLADGNYHVGVVKDSAAHFFFMNSLNPKAEEVYKRLMLKDEQNINTNIEQGLKRVCRANFALIHPIDLSNEIPIARLNEFGCRILRQEREFLTSPLSIPISPKFKYRWLFQYYLEELREIGVSDKLHRQFDTRFASKDDNVEAPSVDITQVTPLLTELAIAVGLSVLFLTIEYLWPNPRRKTQMIRLTGLLKPKGKSLNNKINGKYFIGEEFLTRWK